MGTSSVPGRSPLPRAISEGRMVAIGRRPPTKSVPGIVAAASTTPGTAR